MLCVKLFRHTTEGDTRYSVSVWFMGLLMTSRTSGEALLGAENIFILRLQSVLIQTLYRRFRVQ
jgi:hypothetical protein